ncbi:MAG: hypothetical protein HETSPECPRED_001965 [Heterodermia speciosa]|uniref:CorA-like transporter domain-containing protein n=1 Tax=Heterodermia speciosa TaxID=116794 RepID=A0A8H3F4V7_9LECA|nr:MAG: hypothetical protein HETSPECPRED_001965 [Heterodermia speciosa]
MQNASADIDAGYYKDRLREIASRLFPAQNDAVLVEILRVTLMKTDSASMNDKGGGGSTTVTESCNVANCDSLERQIMVNEVSAKDCLYVIRQEHSWSPLTISLPALESILRTHRVFPQFYNVLQSYGIKEHEDHHDWTGFCYNIEENPAYFGDQVTRRHECCYNFHYVERNNRNRGDPWSLRQMGLYQQFDFSSDRTMWLILQPPGTILDATRQIWNENETGSRAPQRWIVQTHLLYMSLMVRNWQEYLDYLQSDLASFNNKACFSRVGIDYRHDYSVTFLDCQDLQLLQQKLERTSKVLEANLAVARGCATNLARLTSPCTAKVEALNMADAENSIEQLQSNIRRIRSIIKQSDGISSLDPQLSKRQNDARYQPGYAGEPNDAATYLYRESGGEQLAVSTCRAKPDGFANTEGLHDSGDDVLASVPYSGK